MPLAANNEKIASTVETDLLANLIDQKHAVLLQLRELSQRQLHLIDENNMSDLLSLLSAKQTLLTQLQRVESQLNPFRQQDPEQRVWRAPADRRRCAETAAASRGVLDEIMEMEKQGEGRLRENRDRTANKLERVHQGGEVRSAYLQSPQRTGRRLDLASET